MTESVRDPSPSSPSTGGEGARTFGAVLDANARQRGDKVAVIVEDDRLTFAELRERAARVARGLGRHGIGRGDTVAIWLDNCVEWMVSYWAAAAAGVTLVPLNTRFRRRELVHALSLTRARALILGPGVPSASFPEIYREVADELPLIENVWGVGTDAGEDWYGLEAGDPVDAWTGGSDDVVFVQFTSGTTGMPKGVALRASRMLENAGRVGDRMRMDAETRVIFPGPLYHVLGAVLATLAPLARGGTVVLTRSFDARATLALAERERCTIHFGLETMLIEELRVQRETPFDLSSLDVGMMAGSPALYEEVRTELHMPGLIMGFGMSETTASAATTVPDDPVEVRATTVGRPLEGCEIRIVDPEDGTVLGPGEEGEIRLRGTNVFDHSYNQPEATAAAFDDEGWFRSGTAAASTRRGGCASTGGCGRRSGVGGENVSPIEVEELISEHPRVRQVQVVGVPDERLQSVPVAWVETTDGTELDADELIGWCRGKLASFKLPRAVVRVTEWPLTGTGKVQRQALRDMWSEKEGGPE